MKYMYLNEPNDSLPSPPAHLCVVTYIIYDWSIVNCDVKQTKHGTSVYTFFFFFHFFFFSRWGISWNKCKRTRQFFNESACTSMCPHIYMTEVSSIVTQNKQNTVLPLTLFTFFLFLFFFSFPPFFFFIIYFFSFFFSFFYDFSFPLLSRSSLSFHICSISCCIQYIWWHNWTT